MAHTEPSASNAGVPGPNAANAGAQIQDANPQAGNPPPTTDNPAAKVWNDGIKLLEVLCVNANLTSFRSLRKSLQIDIQ